MCDWKTRLECFLCRFLRRHIIRNTCYTYARLRMQLYNHVVEAVQCMNSYGLKSRVNAQTWFMCTTVSIVLYHNGAKELPIGPAFCRLKYFEKGQRTTGYTGTQIICAEKKEKQWSGRDLKSPGPLIHTVYVGANATILLQCCIVLCILCKHVQPDHPLHESWGV